MVSKQYNERLFVFRIRDLLLFWGKLLAEAEHTDKPVLMVFAVKNMLILEVVVLSQDLRFIATYLFF